VRNGNLLPGRLDWYDRTPLAVMNNYQQTVAPHVTTVRWSYTVPAGRKAYLETAHCSLLRAVVAAPANFAAVQQKYTPSGGSTGVYVISGINTNNVGDQFALQVGASFLGFAGDAFEGSTVDQSVGGTTIMRNFAKLTEFDA
jgi:hypothetical protein